MTHVLGTDELAGFELFARRQPDGTILLGSGPRPTPMADFPEEVTVPGYGTYVLEDVKKNADDMKPDYFPPDHPGWAIEWGVYC